MCDHKGIQSVLDFDKTERNPGMGFLHFRPEMTYGHIPCLWSNNDKSKGNGDKHAEKKSFIMKFVKDAYDTNIDILPDIVKEEFEKMEVSMFAMEY